MVKKRVLLKLSGEVLRGKELFGYSEEMIGQIADDLIALQNEGIELAIVIGGGNIFRGINGDKTGIQRANADYMGMLATVMNSVALADVLEHKGAKARVMSAIPMETIAESYSRKRAIEHLKNGAIVIFGGGTGNPFFTTDTAAALRAVEMDVDMILKATKVDGIYTKDPMKYSDAVRLSKITYSEALEKQYKVMDLTAFAICQEHNMEIRIFNLYEKGNLLKAIIDPSITTVVS